MSDNSRSEDPDKAVLTLRSIMTDKEAGCIIGKGGEVIKSIREESRARIYINDGNPEERVCRVTGATDAIFKAYTLICKKLEEELASRSSGGGRDRRRRGDSRSRSRSPTPVSDDITLRLLVDDSQCGSLIGKGGSKIKSMRESTGASIHVHSRPLPGSSEREVAVTGNRDEVTQCMYDIISLLIETPLRVPVMEYVPARSGAGGGGGGKSTAARRDSYSSGVWSASSSFSSSRRGGRFEDDREITEDIYMTNDVIGMVIGRAGSKIKEIRSISGARISIHDSVETARRRPEDRERRIEISGTPEAVGIARNLIQVAMDQQQMQEDMGRGRRGGGGGGVGGGGGRRSPVFDRYRGPRSNCPPICGPADITNLAGLLAKPEVVAALAAFSTRYTGGGGGFRGGDFGPTRSRSPPRGGRGRDEDRRDRRGRRDSPY